jgi:rhamnosyltransferase
MAAPEVDILLSTFDGAPYLPAQLESLRRQTQESWRLLIRDDGSADGTVGLLSAFARANPNVAIVREPAGRLGVRDSFFALLGKSTAPYFMFCDQDDVWLPGKIAETLNPLRTAPADEPSAAFTDLRVVDADAAPVAESFMAFQRINLLEALQWPRLLTQNAVVGCTLMGNAALRKKALEPPAANRDAALMHDGWLALIARSMGQLIYLDRPTVLYRQHGGNVLGSKRGGLARYAANLRRGEGLGKGVRYFRKICRQADAFRACYGPELNSAQRAVLDCLAEACGPDGRVGMRGYLRAVRAGARMTSRDQDLAVALSILVLGRRPE